MLLKGVEENLNEVILKACNKIDILFINKCI